MRPVYSRLLADELESLSPEIGGIHRQYGQFRGWIKVETANSFPVRMVGALFGFPTKDMDEELYFTSVPKGDRDIWTRQIGSHVMKTELWATADGRLAEKLGPITATSRMECIDGAIKLRQEDLRFLGVRLPKFLNPKVETSERGEAGQYKFSIRIELPVLKVRLIAYHGAIDPLSNPLES